MLTRFIIACEWEAQMALHRLVALALLLLIQIIVTPFTASAQNPAPPATASSEQLLKPEELGALVAPIALYPDTLLSLVLMASTYPLEVVQADRWVKENKNLKGDQLKAAVDKQAWDDSVKSLVATPDVLSTMSAKLDWTQKLGNAVLAQQPDVMDAIQRLRTKADANNKLISTKEQRVVKQQEDGKQVIYVEQTDPDTVYVPYYDPSVVYGGWSYPEYPPYYFSWPGYIAAGVIATGIAFGAGYALGRWASGGYFWGGGLNWRNNNININRPRVNPLNGGNWQHNPVHRQGVRYNNVNVQQRFGNTNIRAGNQNRLDFRGRAGNQVLRPGGPGAGLGPGGERPGGGLGPGAGQRPRAGQLPAGGRPSVGQRPSGGRPSAGSRPSGGRDNAFGNVGSGRAARHHSSRGRQSLGGGGARRVGGGAARRVGGGGGGGFRGGGRGGGRRSDITLKHDIVLLGHLANGIGYYRFSYNGSNRAYVGVIAQEVQAVMPKAVVHDRDGSLRVFYEKLGIRFQTYEEWITSGARVPAGAAVSH